MLPSTREVEESDVTHHLLSLLALPRSSELHFVQLVNSSPLRLILWDFTSRLPLYHLAPPALPPPPHFVLTGFGSVIF